MPLLMQSRSLRSWHSLEVAGRGRDEAPRQPNEEVISDATRSYIRTLRAKAKELRTIAAHMKSEHARELFWNAAANYDWLADETEAREKLKALRSRSERGDLGMLGMSVPAHLFWQYVIPMMLVSIIAAWLIARRW